MGIKLGILRPKDPDLVRALQIIQTALDQVPDSVTTTTPHVETDYKIQTTDAVVFADPGAGSITVLLPASNTRPVAVINLSQTGAVTVKTTSGANIGNGQPSILVPQGSALNFAFDPTLKKYFVY